MMIAENIEFFVNLAQIDYEGQYYDFHNDYECERIVLNENHTLTLQFKNSKADYFLLLRFMEADIVSMDIFNVSTVKYLTLDNVYRGRVVINGNLEELSNDGRAYFYLEFYEGLKIEFWAKKINIERI